MMTGNDPKDFPEEGDKCPVGSCSGTLGYAEVENCTCHISPPCGSCTDNPLVCLVCGEEFE